MTNAPNLWKLMSTVKTAVFDASSRLPHLEAGLSGKQISPHCFRRTLTLGNAEIVFNSRILVTLLGAVFVCLLA